MKKISLLVMCISIAGCRLLLDVDSPQCEIDAECTDLFGSAYICGEQGVCVRENAGEQDAAMNMQPDATVKLDDRFDCIETPDKVPPKPSSGQVRLDVQIVDFLTLEPPDGVLLNACSVRDPACATPLLEDVSLDAMGFASVDLPYGFDGYFEASGGGYVPALFTINRPINADLSLAGPSLLSPGTLQALIATNQDTMEPGTGVVVVEVVDCNADAVAGVSLDVEGLPDISPYYIDGNLPNLNLSSTKISTGLSAGMLPRAVGGFNNVPPGVHTVRATLESPKVAFSRASIIVRADVMTFVRVYPGVVQ